MRKRSLKSYIDAERIGIWGWSYGGHMSTNCILKGNDVFALAIAVAPVTNWRFYDNIYTERFMRTPQENGINYDVNSPINYADRLKGKYLLKTDQEMIMFMFKTQCEWLRVNTGR